MPAWRLFAALCASLALGACETTTAPQPAASLASPPELGRSRFVVVARVQPGDTAASLAARYLHDPAQAWRVEALDGALRSGSTVAIPLQPTVAGAGRTARYVPVLCYHRFTPGASSGPMVMGAERFDEELRWLKDNGYAVVPLHALQAFLQDGAPLPPKAIVITLDDGYASAYSVAYPILRRYGDPFTLFVYTDFVGAGAGLSWGEIEAMARSGLAEVQSHSKSHADLVRRLAGESPAAYHRRLHAEIEVPDRLVAERLGAAPTAFAYPYGSANAEVVQTLGQAGYPLGLTVARGGNPAWADPLLLRRDMVLGQDGLETFAARIQAAERGETSDRSDTEDAP